MLKRTILVTSMIFFASMATAFADSTAITKEMVNEKYQKLENVMNNRSDYQSAVKFLHEHISEDARFRLTVTNPTVSGRGKGPEMEMDKAGYINTYIQGTQFVEGYEIDIQMAGFRYDASAQKASTTEIMTERGTVSALNNPAKPFVSRTTCQTEHRIQEGNLVSTSSQCHTDISFEEEI